MTPSTRRIEQLAGLCVLLPIAVGCFVILRPFFAALLWATILSISTWPAFRRLERVLGGRTTLAAALMTILLGIRCWCLSSFSAPVSPTTSPDLPERCSAFSRKGYRRRRRGWRSCRMSDRHSPTPGFTSQATRRGSRIPRVSMTDRRRLLGLGTKLGGGILDLTLSVIAAFFFFAMAPMGETGRSAARRVAGERGHRLLAVAEMTISGVVYGMLGTALAQERSPHLDSGSPVCRARSFWA